MGGGMSMAVRDQFWQSGCEVLKLSVTKIMRVSATSYKRRGDTELFFGVIVLFALSHCLRAEG